MTIIESKIIFDGVRILANRCYQDSKAAGWWPEGEPEELNPLTVPTKIALIHSELSEALEGHRKGLRDAHLPRYPAFTVELADAVIRICDLAEAYHLDLAGAIVDKLEYNLDRPDHTKEARQSVGGKKY
jgi:hypothetical protein